MKLLIATGIYPPESGGPATYVKLLEEKLPPRGFEVTVLPFRDVRDWPPGIRHLVYFLKCLAMARDADIVYAQDTVSVGYPAALAAAWAGKKFIVRVPGDYAWEQGRQRFGVEDELDEFQTKRYGIRVGLLRALQRYVVGKALRVVVPSEYMKKIVIGWLGSSDKVSMIYSSIELPVPVTPLKNRPPGFLVVTIARQVPWKGLDGLMRVVTREKAWNLKIVDGLSRAEAMGWVKAADAFVINSTYEGLSHALVEAMSLGIPVVATSVGGNPELIRDKVDGLLIPAKNDEALHAALKSIESDPAGARMRAETAKSKLSQFSIDETVGKLASLLTTV
jgi:glycosyltransferase involved in cell wall biosynthesis